jgi:thiamine biosynthesis lipoprotein
VNYYPISNFHFPKTMHNQQPYRFTHNAMATIYEIVVYHDDAHYAHQAAWEAFRELDWLEQELSRFVENSDVARINLMKPEESLVVGPDVFECLMQCTRLYEATHGAFDVTIGSLMNCWLHPDKTLREPVAEELSLARQSTGLHNLKLDESTHTVQLLRDAIRLDFGGFGKGYAVDQMSELLLDWEFDCFLIHGGKSSVRATDAPPEEKGWQLSISNPFEDHNLLEYVDLKDQAMSASGLQKGHHIIDPRTAQPIQNHRAVWTFAPSAATCDALSTAFMILSIEEIAAYCRDHAKVQTIILTGENDEWRISRFGF